MKRIVGGPIFARHAAQFAPPGYRYAPAGFGFQPGFVVAGPFTDTQTTICLLEGDEGGWFVHLLAATVDNWHVEVNPE